MSFTQWRIRNGGYCPEGEVILTPAVPEGQYAVTGFGPGLPIGLKPFKPVVDELVRVPNTVSDLIIKEIAQFQELGDKYREHGTVHKRGFLLYGPPGTGKTCTLWQIAQESVEKFKAVVIHESHPTHIANVITNVRNIDQKRPIVVMMEDVDNSAHREELELLELLDGKRQINGVVFVATTNYLNQLPSRIRNRPSRFDRVVKIGPPTAEARRAYIESRKITMSPAEMKRWLKDTEELSLAHVKELIISVHVLGIKYSEALKRIRSMAKEAALEAKRLESEASEESED